MSSSSWLQKQRKGELAELAETLGIKNTDGFKKADLEIAIEDHLKHNVSELSSDTRFAPFYKRRNGSTDSPIKKEVSSLTTDVEKTVKSAKRRVTKAAEDIASAITSATDDSEVEPAVTRARTAVARTPSTARSSALAFASQVPLPPSPSVVADAIDRRTAVIRSKVSDAYENSGILEQAQAARETLSTVVSIEALIIAFEAFCVRKEILADRYAFTIPEIKALNFSAYPVKIPDLFLLLTSSFWGPATLWAFTSFIVPLITAYFFNLTSKGRAGRSHTQHFHYAFDPLTFNIVKALLTYVVYVQDFTFGGIVDLGHVARLNSALYGGPQSVLVGCLISIIVTFYEAIIKK